MEKITFKNTVGKEVTIYDIVKVEDDGKWTEVTTYDGRGYIIENSTIIKKN